MRNTILLSLALSPLLLLPPPAAAITTICNGELKGTGANRPAIATIGGAAPCPVPSLSVSLNSVGTGASVDGNSFVYTLSAQPYGAGLALTTNKAVRVGTGNNRTVTFGRAVTNPYLVFSYIDAGSTYTFNSSFELVSANRATRSGSTITATNAASDLASDGFVVKLLGSITSSTFAYSGTGTPSIGFTAGVAATPAPAVPGPLPIVGAAAAWGASRRLRRRIRQAAVLPDA